MTLSAQSNAPGLLFQKAQGVLYSSGAARAASSHPPNSASEKDFRSGAGRSRRQREKP